MTWSAAAYLGVGVVLGVLGGAAALAILMVDRLGGGHRRRRCRRCWFDLSGTPGLTCPECGKTARSERVLFRTRWRWKRAAGVASGMGLAGVVVAGWPQWSAGQWFDMLPRLAQLEAWTLTKQPEQSLRTTMRGIRANWLKRRAMELTLGALVDKSTPTSHAAAARMALTQEFAAWPLSDRARVSLLRLMNDPALGCQRDAVTAVRYRDEADDELFDSLAALANNPGGGERQNAVETLTVLGMRQRAARARLVRLLRDAEASGGWTDASDVADALVRASLLRQEELLDAYLEGSPRVRVALAMSAEREVTGYALGAMAPYLLDAYMFDRYSELYFAAEVALKGAGAKADAVIACAVEDARGEPLARLLALIATRPANNAIVAEALERAGRDRTRDEHERGRLLDAAEWCRRVLQGKVTDTQWQDALKAR